MTTTLNWQNVDVMTPEDLFLSVSLLVLDGEAQVFADRNRVVASGKIVDWRHAGSPRLYLAKLDDGSRWEVVKLKCKCANREKSGRIWA